MLVSLNILHRIRYLVFIIMLFSMANAATVKTDINTINGSLTVKGGVNVVGNITSSSSILVSTTRGLGVDTKDGSDNGYNWISGGGLHDQTRGGFIQLFGNEYSSSGIKGTVYIIPGLGNNSSDYGVTRILNPNGNTVSQFGLNSDKTSLSTNLYGGLNVGSAENASTGKINAGICSSSVAVFNAKLSSNLSSEELLRLNASSSSIVNGAVLAHLIVDNAQSNPFYAIRYIVNGAEKFTVLGDGSTNIAGTANVQGKLMIPTSTPANASAIGTQGTITYDSNYIYVCVATNTWKRVAISTW